MTPSAWRTITGIYFLATSLGHLEFSLWLVRSRQWGTHSYAFKEFVPDIAVVAAIVLFAWIMRSLRHHPRRLGLVLCWSLWGICIGLVDRYLTFSINETAHYPQYALLAWLIAKSIDPRRTFWPVARILFWTTLLGIADETLQYLWITRSYSDYLDFNDFLVNLLAAVAGVLLYYGNAHSVVPSCLNFPRRPYLELATTGLLVVFLGLGFYFQYLQLTPQQEVPPGGIVRAGDGQYRVYLQRKPGAHGAYHPGPRHNRYWVLDPGSGMFLLVLCGTVFAAAITRLQHEG